MIYMISESLPLCGGHWLTVNTDKDNQHNVGYWNQMKTIPGINERVIFQLTNSPVIAQMFELLKRTPIKKILLSLSFSLSFKPPFLNDLHVHLKSFHVHKISEMYRWTLVTCKSYNLRTLMGFLWICEYCLIYIQAHSYKNGMRYYTYQIWYNEK